jgi:ubiquinone biosynthesis protein
MQPFGFLKLRRALHVTRVLLNHGVRMLWQRLRPGSRTQDGPDWLRRFLEELGGTYIKFGQVLSLQPDALPVAYCNALFDLLDKVPPFPYHHVEQTFIEDLGLPPGEIFDHFDQQPIASASIGQVHFALLDGRKLAVKVRRPTVESDFAADILMMRTFASAIELLRFKRWAWLARATREFCTWTHEELDYRYEARFMATLGYNARDNEQEAVPELLTRYTTTRILVAEFMEGPMVLDYIRSLDRRDPELETRLEAMHFDREEFARNIVRNFVSDAFHHGMFHADLHPANLFILHDNVVGYVDFGITGTLSPHSRRSMVSLTLALTRADLDGMMIHFRSITDIEDSSDLDAFREGLDALLDKWFERNGPEPELRTTFSIVMLDMLKLSRRTNVWPTPDVIRYLRSVITADGLITRFAAELDVGRHLESVCKEYLQANIWREWLAMENIADLASEGIALLSGGSLAAARALERDSTDTRETDDSTAAVHRQVLQYGLIGLFSAFLASAGTTLPEWGLNLFTAEVLVAATACILLLRTLRRLQ